MVGENVYFFFLIISSIECGSSGIGTKICEVSIILTLGGSNTVISVLCAITKTEITRRGEASCMLIKYMQVLSQEEFSFFSVSLLPALSFVSYWTGATSAGLHLVQPGGGPATDCPRYFDLFLFICMLLVPG